MKNQLYDPELASLSIIHLAHEGGDDFYLYSSDYFKPNDKIDFKEFWERDQLIISPKEVKIIADGIRAEKLIENDISDWELVTTAITVYAEQMYCSRTKALEQLSDYYHELLEPENYRYLAYI